MPVGKPDILPHRENRNGAGRQTTKDVLEADNLCFMGTDVMSGTATAVVVATGSQTIFGSLAGRVLVQQDTTSFDQGIRSVSWVLIRFMAIMVPVVFLINGMTKGNWPDAFLFSLAVAVGLTPEMLPMVVSVNLAKGAIRMAKEKVIVKRISAIQDFGAMDILCTDKTGTLTEDRVMLREHLDMNGNESENVLQLAYLNSSLQTGLKNLMDEAIIEHMESEHRSTGLQHLIKIDEIPFDFMRRRMSVVVADETGQHLFICKGATEEMLEACTQVEIDGQILPLNEPMRDKARTLIRQRNEGGMRTIAVGYRYFPAHREEYVARDESQLVLAGFVGFLDPPKASAARALAALREHGVKVKVLTGDSEAVVGKICREVGLAPADIVSGHTVGFLGDGINDAAALREADVGISVDTAVDIAKESADIILLEKSLLVLEQGVMEGRKVFGNIVKYIKMTASSNFGNVFSVLVASAFIPFLPMLPIQLLTQNLLYDFSQFSLPWDTMDEEFLAEPRKWDSASIARFMIYIGPISSIFDIAVFVVMWYVFGANSIEQQSLFQSGWFVLGLLSQTLIVHLIRTEKIPFVQSRATRPVLLFTGMIIAVGTAMPFTKFGAGIGLQPLPLAYFPWLIALLFAYCVTTQWAKRFYIRRFASWL
jgi:Mg2+-importing ATPase